MKQFEINYRMAMCKHYWIGETMGLDLVELAMAIEDEFDIHTKDEDAVNITIPQMLADYVILQLSGKGKVFHKAQACISQVQFYCLRRILMQAFNRSDIRPQTSIQPILAKNKYNRKQKSQLMQAIVSGKLLTELEASGRIFKNLPLISVLLASGICFALHGWLGLLVALLFAGVALIAGSTYAPFAKYTTLASLVPLVTVSDKEDFACDKYYILYWVRQITSEQLGMDFNKVLLDAHFVKDLYAC